jgi:hypothetical protein
MCWQYSKNKSTNGTAPKLPCCADIIEFSNTHGFNEHTHGYYDFRTRSAVYFDSKDPDNKDKIKSFKSILVGTGNLQQYDFIWAWGNQHMPQDVIDAAKPLYNFGQKNQLPEFVERALFINELTSAVQILLTNKVSPNRLSQGFKANVMMDNGTLFSRFSSREMFAIITHVLNARMSSILPIHGVPYHAYSFIV